MPEVISVTGSDNIKRSEFCSPTLTTVHIPRESIGQKIFEIFVPEGSADKLAGQEILIDPVLVVRESTSLPRGKQVSGSNPK